MINANTRCFPFMKFIQKHITNNVLANKKQHVLGPSKACCFHHPACDDEVMVITMVQDTSPEMYEKNCKNDICCIHAVIYIYIYIVLTHLSEVKW